MIIRRWAGAVRFPTCGDNSGSSQEKILALVCPAGRTRQPRERRGTGPIPLRGISRTARVSTARKTSGSNLVENFRVKPRLLTKKSSVHLSSRLNNCLSVWIFSRNRSRSSFTASPLPHPAPLRGNAVTSPHHSTRKINSSTTCRASCHWRRSSGCLAVNRRFLLRMYLFGGQIF